MLKSFLLYIVLWTVAVFAIYEGRNLWYEMSFDWISCEEALFRNNGYAAPRTEKEENDWNRCLFQNVTRWSNE